MSGSKAAPPPRARVLAECAKRGQDAVVTGCASLLTGGPADVPLIMVLGGPGAEWALELPEERDHWFRIWAARGLLWAYDPAARPAVLAGLRDEQWRVREMCAKVVARHLVGDALSAVLTLRDDQVPRVRTAADRAVRQLTAAGT
jgi:HEAT repeat protein